MVELLAEIESLNERINSIRENLDPLTPAEELESRIRSVHASLVIDEPDLTFEEVREVLSLQVNE